MGMSRTGRPMAEITETRTGNWLVECACGFAENLGPHAGLSLAKDFLRYHIRGCSVVTNTRNIGFETNAQRWREAGGIA